MALNAIAPSLTPYRVGLAPLPDLPRLPNPPESARTAPAGLTESDPERFLDGLRNDPEFRRRAAQDPIGTIAALMTRELPPTVERELVRKAGSSGGARVQLLLDLCRGWDAEDSFLKALVKNPSRALVEHLIGPELFHFRTVDGVNLFPNDSTFAPALRDSLVWDQPSTQVSHMLFSVEMGMRTARMEQSAFQRFLYGSASRAALRVAGVRAQGPAFRDLARAAIIGHELLGDQAFGLGQVQEFGKLVDHGDPHGIRGHFDAAVTALMDGNHEEAWTHIHAIADAGEIPRTRAEADAMASGKNVRFGGQAVDRSGDTLADLALSIYGFALGTMAGSNRFESPRDAADTFTRWLSKDSPLSPKLSRYAEGT